jgi:D-threo-aldose 1-dehydrogenase
LGQNGLVVSQLGFGSAPLGGLFRSTSQSDATTALQAAWDAGLRYFDTAPQYGHGLAETRIGAFLAHKNRNEFVLSSKIGKLLKARSDGSAPTSAFVDALPNDIEYDYSYDATLRSFDQSLARLGLERIDVLFVHDVNRKYHGSNVFARLNEALKGACKALERLRDEKTIGAFGPALQDTDIAAAFVERAPIDCIMLPGSYNLLVREAEKDLLPACEKAKVSVLIAGPFASGILATGAIQGATFNYAAPSEALMHQVKALEALCASFDVPLPAAALQFPMRTSAVKSVVTGMRSAREVAQNVEFMRLSIPDELWIAVDGILGQPGN